MEVVIFFAAHWYLSLFCQTFFHHRYAAHQMFTMSKGWEKFFFILSFITQGSSYLSPYAYGLLHRQHHAYPDQEKDPHSPRFDRNLFTMMWRTKRIYNDIFYHRYPVEERFKGDIPTWHSFDKLADRWPIRVAWCGVYIAFYAYFVGDQYWLWALLPIQFVMGPFHGAIINWFAHKYGYTNFKVSDTSKNLMPVDIFMMGEGYHNNHHSHGDRPNFGYKWHEIDPVYPFILLFNAVGIIKLKKPKPIVKDKNKDKSPKEKEAVAA